MVPSPPLSLPQRAAGAVDVEGDVGRMVEGHRDPESTHAYARALVILDWGWRRQQQLREARLRVGGPVGRCAGGACWLIWGGAGCSFDD